jgi:Rrf2 family protein
VLFIVLQLTKRTEYGLIALMLLAERQGAVVSAREIGERFPIPRRLLAEVLKELCRSSMVESHRGASGGYALARPAESISVGEVVGVLEGRPSLTNCSSRNGGSSAKSCEVEKVCPIRSPIQKLWVGIWELLEHTTLSDLAQPLTATAATTSSTS